MDLLKVDLGDYISPRQLLSTVLICTYILQVFELYLNYRQNRVYKTAKEVPEVLKGKLDKETFEKSREYEKDKNVFSSIADIYHLTTLTALLLCDGIYKGWELTDTALAASGLWPEDWDREIGRSICFSIVALLFNTVVGLPLRIYSVFVLEEKHGFNKQTVAFFIKDLIKYILVSVVFMSPIVGLIVKIVQAGGDFFFIYLWVFSFVVLLFFMTIYPVVIAPLFDKYTPLREGPLKTRIETLAAKIKFPLTKLYVVEGSKRSAHSNAYLYGFFNNKRIVLFDTLIKGYVIEESNEPKNEEENKESEDNEEKKEAEDNKEKKEEKGCTDEEIEGVLGHELGHWKLSHVLQNIVISQLNLLFVFAFFALLQKNSVLYEAFGFPKNSEQPVLIGLTVILQFVLQIYNTAMGYLMTIFSRRNEFQADQFAVDLGYGNVLKNALIKLNKDNLGFPICDSWYSSWHHSHPTLLQRLAVMDEQMSKLK